MFVHRLFIIGLKRIVLSVGMEFTSQEKVGKILTWPSHKRHYA
ncbi:MAG: hypothetical protein SNJ67_09050 [Chloracidobacterium sp.]